MIIQEQYYGSNYFSVAMDRRHRGGIDFYALLLEKSRVGTPDNEAVADAWSIIHIIWRDEGAIFYQQEKCANWKKNINDIEVQKVN